MSVILFFVLGLLGAKFAHRGEFFADNFSYDSTRALKGIFALAVLFHHLFTYLAESMPSLAFFENLGFLAVGGFFLISGYGLDYGMKCKKNYLHDFFRRRFLGILIPYYLIIPFYYFVRWKTAILTKEYIILSLFGVDIWFVGVIAVLYLSFYVSFRLFGRKWGALAQSVFTAAFALTMLILYRRGIVAGFGFWYYNALPCFLIGMWYCEFQSEINRFFKAHYLPLLLLSLFIFAASFYYSFRVPEDAQRLYVLALEIFCTASFSVVVLLLTMKVCPGNCLLNFCGDISFEFYLTHALWIYFLRSDLDLFGYTLYLASPDLYLAGVIVTTAISSFAIHKLSKWIHGLLIGSRQIAKPSK